MCEMCRLLVILLCLVVTVTLEYDLKCPDSGEWRLRAIGFNCSIKSQYVCLFKYTERTYHETCDGLDYSSIGSKLIYEPFFNKAYCSYERYQPFPFSTDGNSKCVYKKSFCTEKGQYLFQRGSQRSDITCGCDLTKGYEFVTKPNLDCYCVPSAEDCSCYRIPCNNLVDQCPQDRDEILTTSVLTTFQENRFKDAINIFDDKNNGKTYRFQCLYITSALLACMIIAVILFLVVWINVQRAKQGWNKTRKARLSQRDKTRFNKLMQSEKTEKRYFVRIMIVGKESVGKTCLLRRLLKENITDVTSTDGVNIVVSRCKINMEDGQWIIGKEIHDDKMGRIKRALNTNTEDRDTHHKQVNETKNIERSQTDEIPTDNKETTTDDDTNESSSLIIHHNEATEVNVSIDKNNDTNESASFVIPEALVTDTKVDLDNNTNTNESTSFVIPEDLVTDTKVDLDNNKNTNESTPLVMPADLMSNVFSKSTENTLLNIYALCELWDFAGQKEFYATHQAFLTSCAVYIVVADMRDDICKQSFSQCFDDFKKIGEYVDFWFDSIHCHRTTNEPTSYGHIDPPILLVFTGKDKYKKADFMKREKELNDQMNSICGLNSKYYHLHNTFYLSNKEDSDEEFEKLRYAIYETARRMDNWGKAFPLKWILLEHLIEINKNDGKNFINFTEMFKLAKHPDINILKEEDLLLFLRFQHNVGNIIFFEDILDLIILRPQWLADAYRCLVSDRIGNRRLHNLKDWTLFTRQGKISESLITELFELKGGLQFSGQNINLHKVMEKLDILVKLENSSYSIMPSQMPSITFDVVCEKFGILTEKCKRTSWLCFKFEFLPPSFFNHLSAWFIRNYNPSKVDDSVALYRGICMFDIDGSGCKKIMVTMSTDTIALQVTSFSEEQEGFGSTCSDIYREVAQLIEDTKHRYKVKLSYKLHFKCSDGYYYKNTFDYEKLKNDKECFCGDHKKAHQFEHIYSLWMKKQVIAKLNKEQTENNPRNIVAQRIAYDRKFLMRLRKSVFSQRRPDIIDHFPEIQINSAMAPVTDKPAVRSKPKPKRTHSPAADAPPGAVTTQPQMTTEEIMRKAIGAINMVKHGCDASMVVKVISDLPINTEDALSRIVNLVVDTAVDDASCLSVCTSLCRVLSRAKVQSRNDPGESVTFSTAYRQKCTKEIEQGILNRSTESHNRRIEEIARFTGSIARLILLKTSDIHAILMKFAQTKSEKFLECFCTLLTEVWERMEKCTSANYLDQYFEVIDEVLLYSETNAALKYKLGQLKSRQR